VVGAHGGGGDLRAGICHPADLDPGSGAVFPISQPPQRLNAIGAIGSDSRCMFLAANVGAGFTPARVMRVDWAGINPAPTSDSSDRVATIGYLTHRFASVIRYLIYAS
jgi:hypothetical protein